MTEILPGSVLLSNGTSKGFKVTTFQSWRSCEKVCRVLIKVVLFQLRGRGHPQDDATPNFFPNSKGSIFGLSYKVSFVSEFN